MAMCQEDTVIILPDVSPGALDAALAIAYSGEVEGLGGELVGQVRDLCTVLSCSADLITVNQQENVEVEMNDNIAMEEDLDYAEEFAMVREKVDDKEVFKCSYCEKTFIFAKSYERHVDQCGAREGNTVAISSFEGQMVVENSLEAASTSGVESCVGMESRSEVAGSVEPRRAKRARVKTAKGGEFEGGGGGVGELGQGGERFQFVHFEQRESVVWCTFPGCTYHSSSPGFKTLGGCKNHQLVQHATDSQKPFACRFCDKFFASNQLRNKHENLAHVKRFPCTSCDKVFSEKTRLLVHNRYLLLHLHLHLHLIFSRIHSGEKPYVCDLCGFSCAQKDNLRLHKEFKHPGPGQPGKRFVCPICGASFLTKSNLSRHTISHTDAKQSVCETCGKTFKDPAALRQHTFSHGGEEFGCGECGQTFTSPLYLSRHMVGRPSSPSLPHPTVCRLTPHLTSTLSTSPTPPRCAATPLTACYPSPAASVAADSPSITSCSST